MREEIEKIIRDYLNINPTLNEVTISKIFRKYNPNYYKTEDIFSVMINLSKNFGSSENPLFYMEHILINDNDIYILSGEDNINCYYKEIIVHPETGDELEYDDYKNYIGYNFKLLREKYIPEPNIIIVDDSEINLDELSNRELINLCLILNVKVKH